MLQYRLALLILVFLANCTNLTASGGYTPVPPEILFKLSAILSIHAVPPHASLRMHHVVSEPTKSFPLTHAAKLYLGSIM